MLFGLNSALSLLNPALHCRFVVVCVCLDGFLFPQLFGVRPPFFGVWSLSLVAVVPFRVDRVYTSFVASV